MPWKLGSYPVESQGLEDQNPWEASRDTRQADRIPTDGSAPNGLGKESLRTLFAYFPKPLRLGKGETLFDKQGKGAEVPNTTCYFGWRGVLSQERPSSFWTTDRAQWS